VPAGADGLLMTRPEAVLLGAGAGQLGGKVVRAQDLGGCVRYIVACDAALGDVTVDDWRATEEHAEGSPVALSLTAADTVLFLRQDRA